MRYFLFIVAAFLLFSGCDSKNSKKDKMEYELFDSTHVFDENTLNELVSLNEDGTMLFTSDSKYAAKLVKDHVILAGMDVKNKKGLLRQIVSIEKTPDGIKVTTKPCPIQRAFKKLHLSMTRPIELSDPDIKWDVMPGTVINTAPAEGISSIYRKTDSVGFGPFSIDYYPFDGDHDPSTPEDQVHAVATMHGELTYTFGIDFDWPDWDEALTGDILPEITAGYYLNAGAGASLFAEGMAIRGFSREDKLAHADLASFAIFPLYFTVSVDLVSLIEGYARSKFTLSTGAEASFEVGALFSSDSGGKLVPPTPSFTTSPVAAKVTESADLKISVGPRVKLLLYDIVGPYAGLKVYASLGADKERPAEQCWQAKIGVEGEIGIEIELFGASLASWGDSFNIADKTLDEGTCYLDPKEENPPDIADPAFDPWSMRIADTTRAWNYDDHLALVQTVDGHWFTAGHNVKTLAKFDNSGSMLWAKEYRNEDMDIKLPFDITAATPTVSAGIVALTAQPIGILNLSNDGMLLWNRIPELSAQSPHAMTSVIEMNDGFLVGGSILDPDTSDNDGWLFKIDRQGTVLWSKRFGESDRNEFITAMVKNADGVFIVGRSFGLSQDPAAQSFVMYLNNAGAVDWVNAVSACGDSLNLNSALLSQDGDLIAGGAFGDGHTHAVLAKFKSADGALGWVNGMENDTITTLGLTVIDFVQLTDGGYLASGTVWTAGETDYIFVTRTDAVGRPVWTKRLSDLESDAAAAVALNGDGGALIAGYSVHKNNEDEDGSLLVSRIGVKKGTLDIPAGSGSLTDETVTTLEDPCFSVILAKMPLTDAPITFTSANVTVKNVTKQVEKLK